MATDKNKEHWVKITWNLISLNSRKKWLCCEASTLLTFYTLTHSRVLGWFGHWWQIGLTFLHWQVPLHNLCNINTRLMEHALHWVQQLMSSVHKHNTEKVYRGNGGKAPHILHLGTRWMWTVSFMLWLFHPYRKNLWHMLNSRLGGPQDWSGGGVK